MPTIIFAHQELLPLAIFALMFPLVARLRRSALPATRISLYKGIGVGLVSKVLMLLLIAAWIALVFAEATPIMETSLQTTVQQGIEIGIPVDVSGSMESAIVDDSQLSYFAAGATATAAPTGGISLPHQATRIDVAAKAIAGFVRLRTNDKIALAMFNDTCQWWAPLSVDHDYIINAAAHLPQYISGGTNFDGPSNSNSNPGAIQCMIDHLKEFGTAKTKIIVMVTDGDDSINPQRFDELSAEMRQAGIKMYVIGVGESWKGTTELDLSRFTKALGGKVFVVGSGKDMVDAFAEIDRLETTPFERVTGVQSMNVYQYPEALGLVLLALWVVGTVFFGDDL